MKGSRTTLPPKPPGDGRAHDQLCGLAAIAARSLSEVLDTDAYKGQPPEE